MADGMHRFGALLQMFRTKAGLSQEELAERAGLSRRGISDLERGTRQRPYPQTARRLADALGLDETARAQLQAAVRDATRTVQSQSIPEPPDRQSVPLPLTSFVGRERELESVRRLLASSRLLTLVGTGGVGKTRLAFELARDLVRHYPDGVVVVELAALSDPSLVDHGVAAAMSVRDQAGRSVAENLINALRDKCVLLVLDNCEHLIPACSQLVHKLLTSCPELHVLATSREPLGLAGEWRWRVPSLSVPDSSPSPTCEELEASEAVRLLVERARAVLPDFGQTEHELQLVAEICRRLDGIPLAIELVAPLVSALSLEQIVDHLEDRFALLTSGAREALPRHRTLRAMVDWSFDLLEEPECRLFERLSVFAGGWTLDAAECVCAGEDLRAQEVLHLLVRLVDQSLVVAAPVGTKSREQRYRLLETLRQFARDRLEERGDAAPTHERHAAYFLELFERAEQEFLRQFATPDLVGRMDRDLGNLRVALRWLIGQGDVDRAQRLAGSSRPLWLQRVYLAEGRRWLEEALALDPTMGAPNEPAARARALLGLSGVASYQGELAGAEQAGLRALHVFEELHDTARLWGALRFLADIAAARADLAGARHFLKQALVLTHATGQLAGFALNQCSLAELDLEEGNLGMAERYAEEGLKAATAAGNPAISFRALVTLGEVQRRLGRRDATQRLWQEGLTHVSEGHRQHSSILPAMITLGRQATESDDARSWLIEGLLLVREGNRWQLARGLEVVVDVAAAEGHAEIALRVAGAAAALRDRMAAQPWPSERARLDAAISRARQSLAEDAAEVAWRRGWTRPVDQTLAMALDFLQKLPAGSAAGEVCGPYLRS